MIEKQAETESERVRKVHAPDRRGAKKHNEFNYRNYIIYARERARAALRTRLSTVADFR